MFLFQIPLFTQRTKRRKNAREKENKPKILLLKIDRMVSWCRWTSQKRETIPERVCSETIILRDFSKNRCLQSSCSRLETPQVKLSSSSLSTQSKSNANKRSVEEPKRRDEQPQKKKKGRQKEPTKKTWKKNANDRFFRPRWEAGVVFEKDQKFTTEK